LDLSHKQLPVTPATTDV